MCDRCVRMAVCVMCRVVCVSEDTVDHMDSLKHLVYTLERAIRSMPEEHPQ